MKFKVCFMYENDCRDKAVVEAPNEVSALILAQVLLGRDNGWCGEEGFRISIEKDSY